MDFNIDPNTVLAMAFGSWAAVVGWIGKGVFKRMDAMSAAMSREAEKLNQYITQTEARIRVVEDRLERMREGHE